MVRWIASGKFLIVLAWMGASVAWAQVDGQLPTRPKISMGLASQSNVNQLLDSLQAYANPSEPATHKLRIANTVTTDFATSQQLNRAYAGTAMGLAVAGAQMPALGPGERGVGAGVGYYEGATAIGVMVKKVSATGNGSWQAGASTDGKRFGLSVGMGWKWE
jgi:hypothetical protein